jgi:hypothetical protein
VYEEQLFPDWAELEGLLLQAFADPAYDLLKVWPSAWDAAVRGLAPTS